MFHWRKSPDRDTHIERLERRVAALEARLSRDTETATRAPDSDSGRLESALASLGRVVARAAANAEGVTRQ
jgi:endonuclease III